MHQEAKGLWIIMITDYLEGQFAKFREKLKAKIGTRNIFKLLQ